MVMSVRPTFQAIVDHATSATGASSAWLLAVVGDGLQVIATAGLASGNTTIGTVITPTGAQGYVLSSGQPAALMPQPNNLANDGAAGFPGVPISVLAAPCGDETVLGVLEVAEKEGAAPFTFDDIDAVAVLASIAGAALSEESVAADEVSSPGELAAELTRLATQSPARYADTARIIESLLGQ